ncbi:S26 family signal peptidase [Streptomyces sp. MUM 203J]|uniref:S26 family signal peptidase n=1 Tax=Streptomyces sp. MUM 203J TaxID=2791990 RepID=UPI0035AC1ABA
MRRGDVVLFRAPGRYGGTPVLHRVVGFGGGRVTCRDAGTPMPDGAPLPEPYVEGVTLPGAA